MSSDFSILYIGASWCAPCRTVKPLIQDLAKKFGIPLILQDYDEMEEEEREKVRKLPTVRIMSDTIVEITSNHVDTLDIWLRKNVRVIAEEDF